MRLWRPRPIPMPRKSPAQLGVTLRLNGIINKQNPEFTRAISLYFCAVRAEYKWDMTVGDMNSFLRAAGNDPESSQIEWQGCNELNDEAVLIVNPDKHIAKDYAHEFAKRYLR